MIQTLPERFTISRPWIALVILGIAFRIAIVILAGNQLRASWSGGSDAPHYGAKSARQKGFYFDSVGCAWRRDICGCTLLLQYGPSWPFHARDNIA